MNELTSILTRLTCGFCFLVSGYSVTCAATEVHAPLKADEVRSRILAWLNREQVTDVQRDQVTVIWEGLDESVPADRLLELAVRSFALVDAAVLKLVHDCGAPNGNLLPPGADLFKQPTRDPFFRANLSLFYGRCLVERRFFDEAWEILKNIDGHQVIDPASLFFFQAVAAQGILELKPALDAIDQLLTNTERVPVRYSAVAALMQADLKALKEKSLGDIARLMADSERRLDLGRTGSKVQEVQERIIGNLDEIIKKAEQQQQGGGGGADGGAGGNSNNSGGAAEDSSVKGQEAAGETDKKRFEKKGGWGDLPDKELAKVKNDLNKNFPSHYEQAIEKYTKKLAGRAAKKK